LKFSWLTFAVVAAALVPGIGAQVLATSGPIPLESIGLPPQAPSLTLLGMVGAGKLATDPSLPPKGGAVAEVFYEELRGVATPTGPAGAVEASVRTRFDEQGHVVEQVENRWNQNHELGFHYDDKGRLLGYEFRQGAEDKPFSRTEISYSGDGKTIVVTQTFAGTKIIDRSTRILDDQGRVVQVMVDSEGRDTSGRATKIYFRYDEQGRLVEQTTDGLKFSDSGAEHDLPPGSISIAYDDKLHTKTTKYSVPNEGALESVVMQDESGATIGYSLKGPTERASTKLECQYDRLANWTSCRQIVESQGQRVVKQEFRRTITYR
jgi:YD repeat-containing protein